ncbi:hypothetical protein [Halorussus salinus]|uniref:hypothetical protein n=1 Tax=Halorussus salinus TaxID=1364935 RepID=UPI001091B195|nr:hypothetical protein [Halorussus salinus]
MNATRRELLAGGAALVGGGLAGCSSLPLVGCDAMHESRIEVERETPPEEARDALAPIRVADLPSAEREVAREAIDSGSYAECSPESEGFESLLGRIGDHRDRQQRRSEADLTTVYFRTEDARYAIRAMVLDQLLSY